MSHQWILGMLVQSANSLAVEPLFFDLKVGPDEEFRRQFLNGKLDGVRGFRKAPVPHRPISLAAARGKELSRSVVIEAFARFRHNVTPAWPVAAFWRNRMIGTPCRIARSVSRHGERVRACRGPGRLTIDPVFMTGTRKPRALHSQ